VTACTELAGSASLGAGPALRAVDCLANEAAASAFGRLFGGGASGSGALLPALTILLTLYIAFFAFALITGRSRLGVAALTPRMMTLGLVLTFATSWLAWQQVVWNLAIGAPDQLASLLIGAKGSATQLFADRIDMVSAAIAQAADKPGGDSAQAAAAAHAATTFSPEGLMWLGALLLLLGTVGVLATARIALAVLLAVGPVFVVLALFRGTRGLTAGWLRGVVMTALAPLFVVLAGSIMLELVVPVVPSLRGADGIDARAAMALFLIAAVHCAMMVIVGKVAGTMVSAWTVFGLSGQAADERSATTDRPTTAAVAATAAIAPAELAPVAATTGSRARALVSSQHGGSEHAAPASVEAPQVRSSRTVRHGSTVIAAPAASAPSTLPRPRTQGIGSRFAARPAPHRKMMR
jgi:type IV secretion system protein VirB6